MPENKTMGLNLQRFTICVIALTMVILALGINPAEAARKKRHVIRQPVDRFAAIVIDASTGLVISEKNADKKLYPASLTKMMTLYLTFEALERGSLRRSQNIEVSRRAASQEPSSLGLQPGDAIRVENAILAIATKSANDCAVALAEAIGGSEDRFAAAMNIKARELGMRNTNFVNASGLFKQGQVSSARDMATLSQAIIRDYPKYYRYFSTSSFTYADNTYMNHNKLMSTYRGMDGLKTGYVYASGYNLAASAVRNGTRLIGVIFGGRTAKSRNDAMARMLDQSFARISNIRIAGTSIKGQNSVAASRVAAPQAAYEASAYNPADLPASAAAPQFDAVGLVTDQGDADINEDGKTARIIRGNPPAVPQRLAAVSADKSNWSIQLGAFSSRDAGMKAIEVAKTNLPGAISCVDDIAPLMTSRGMIYRARLSGLARNDATQACRILKGNCLVLAME